MATENIVLLACAAVLCTLHVVGGPLSGLFRAPPPPKRTPVRRTVEQSTPPASASMTEDAEPEIISRAS